MIENTIKKIEQWVVDRNLHTQDPKVQMCKTVEELGELARAINKGDREKQIDSIGIQLSLSSVCQNNWVLISLNALNMHTTKSKTGRGNLSTGYL